MPNPRMATAHRGPSLNTVIVSVVVIILALLSFFFISHVLIRPEPANATPPSHSTLPRLQVQVLTKYSSSSNTDDTNNEFRLVLMKNKTGQTECDLETRSGDNDLTEALTPSNLCGPYIK